MSIKASQQKMEYCILHRTEKNLDVNISVVPDNVSIDDIIKLLTEEGNICRKVPMGKLPKDMTYADAWFFNDQLIIPIDMDINRSKEIVKNRWRHLRAKKFEQLDVEYMKYLERSDQTNMVRISALKNRLRDVTETYSIPERLPSESIDSYSKRLTNCVPDILK